MKLKLIALLCASSVALQTISAQQFDYGLPQEIQDGNILHCFNWSINDVKNNLENIAQAGFGSVQLSPLQRKNVQTSHVWSDVYRPYDFAFQESAALGTAEDLKTLCAEARKYGIKVIVDVVANHIDKAEGYYDPWWKSSSDYYRSWGGSANINYGSRNSITHDRLGDYVEVNSENPEVIARAKAYVQWLKDQGVSGIRWDAAKHIGLPSEGCDFWKEMATVEGMFHYGEILGVPGPSNNEALIKEYAQYMHVTDSRYSDESAESNGGLPIRKNGEWAPYVGTEKLIYWAETHDTYSNTPEYGGWSSSISQATIDRAYASVACREGATALYLARPKSSGYSNIKVVKGNDHYKESAAIREVNKFRNKMNGRSEYFSTSDKGDAISVTRNNGGAVIVMKSSGSFTVPNGGALCPAGTYADRVSGNTINVTAQSITGTADASGIVVIYNDELQPADPDAPVQGFDDNSVTIYYDNSTTTWSQVYCHFWGSNETSTWPGKLMTKMEDDKYGRDIYKVTIASGSYGLFTKGSSGPQTVDSSEPLKANHLYKGMDTQTAGKVNLADLGIYGDGMMIYYDNSETNYSSVCCHYWGGSTTSTFPGVEMSKVEGDIYSVIIPTNTTGILFAQKDKAKQTVDVTNVQDGYLYKGLAELDGTKNRVAPGEPYAGMQNIAIDNKFTVFTSSEGINVYDAEGLALMVAGIDGKIYFHGAGSQNTEIKLAKGIYIVKAGSQTSKVIVK